MFWPCGTQLKTALCNSGFVLIFDRLIKLALNSYDDNLTYLTLIRARPTVIFFVDVILNSSEKTWWTREFTREYLPFVVSNNSLSTLEGMLQKQGIYRVMSPKERIIQFRVLL